MDWFIHHSPLFAAPLLGLCLLLVYHRQKSSRFTLRSGGRPLPPGPPPLPLIGNLLDLPKGHLWLGYQELAKKYGNLVYLKVMGRSILLINDPKIAFDLFEKRSTIYSSRPVSIMARLTGWGWSFAFMPYGQWWRRHRRLFWQHFRPAAISEHQATLEEGAHRLLWRLLISPDKLNEHIDYALGASISKTAHGLVIAEQDDHRIKIFEEALRSTADVLTEGSSLLEFSPFIARIPTWLPWTGFLRRLKSYHKAAALLRELPWAQAKEALSTETGSHSIAAAMIDNISRLDPVAAAEEEGIAMSAAGMVYAAGFDTQVSSLQSLFPALCLHPDVQKKAQAELDAVVGSNRLPTFADRDSLPYVNALVKELLRWHTSVPLGVARSSTADDEYDGYFIPADTTILVNTWAIVHDPDRYPHPDELVPERFLKDGKLDAEMTDTSNIIFGFGRRICPGRYFADSTLFIFIASVLHTFNITPPLDDEGRPIRVKPQTTPGLVSYLEKWRCTIKPRSISMETLVRHGADANLKAPSG